MDTQYVLEILAGLNSQKSCGEFCDVNLLAMDGTKFPVHRCMLAAASSSFYELLISSQTDIFLDVNGDIVRILLEIIYTGKIPSLCTDDSLRLLREMCTNFKMNCILKLLVNYENAKNVEKTGSVRKRKVGRPRKESNAIEDNYCQKKQKSNETDDLENSTKRNLPTRITRGKRGKERLQLIESMKNDKQSYRNSVYDDSMYVQLSDEDVTKSDVASVRKDNETNQECVEKSLDNIMSKLGHVYNAKSNEYISVEEDNSDPSTFNENVSKSLDQIFAKLSSINSTNENETVDLLSGSEKREEWKKCPYCSQFKGIKKGRFQFHIRYCHLPLKCKQCFKPFASQHDADQHRCPLTKPSVIPHVCELCGKTLAGIHALQLHLKIHNNIKNFKCQYCSKAFVRKLQRDSHVKHIHQQDRPFKCAHCYKKFAYNYELNRHYSCHRCPHCSLVIPEKQALDAHVRMCNPSTVEKASQQIEKYLQVKQSADGGLISTPIDIVEKYQIHGGNITKVLELSNTTSQPLAENRSPFSTTIDDTGQDFTTETITTDTQLKEVDTNVSNITLREIVDIENINNLYMCKFCENIFQDYNSINEHFQLNQCSAVAFTETADPADIVPVITETVPLTVNESSVQYLVIENETDFCEENILSIGNQIQADS